MVYPTIDPDIYCIDTADNEENQREGTVKNKSFKRFNQSH